MVLKQETLKYKNMKWYYDNWWLVQAVFVVTHHVLLLGAFGVFLVTLSMLFSYPVASSWMSCSGILFYSTSPSRDERCIYAVSPTLHYHPPFCSDSTVLLNLREFEWTYPLVSAGKFTHLDFSGDLNFYLKLRVVCYEHKIQRRFQLKLTLFCAQRNCTEDSYY
jgi:hypothetical protein